MDTIAVLKIDHEIGTMYLDSLEGIEEQLEYFFGEGGEWKDYIGDKLTITVELIDKEVFEKLEPLDEL